MKRSLITKTRYSADLRQKIAAGESSHIAKQRIVDNRPHAIAQRELKKIINDSFRVVSQRKTAAMMQGGLQNRLQKALPRSSIKTVAQLMTIHSTGSEANPSYDFTVLKNDLNKGTNTTKETREYVNSWKAIPGTVNYAYEIYDVSQADKKVDQDSGSTANPNPMKIGQNWDAGHSLGRQNGGLGDDKGWVFPQNPQFNRGNSYMGQKTYQDWRYCENVFHDSVYQYGKGRWKVWLT